MAEFENAEKEFQPLLKQIYVSEKFPRLNVEPERILCLRRPDKSGDKLAYVKSIKGEYRLLTDKKYFMVVVSPLFDMKSTEEQKWIILHEYHHCIFDEEKGDYAARRHDIEDFSYLLNDPEWNLDLIAAFKYEQKKNDKSEEKKESIPELE